MHLYASRDVRTWLNLKIWHLITEMSAAREKIHQPWFQKNTGTIIPLSKVLKEFFEMPHVLEETISYIAYLETLINVAISKITETSFWRHKSSKAERIVLSIFLYEDDFECENPLSTHLTVYKMAAMYMSLACLPPQFGLKLDYTFLVQITHSWDITSCPDSVVHFNVVNVLNDLAINGIEVKVNEKSFRIFFKLALMVADNVGMNRILGLKTHFNSDFFANFVKWIKIDYRN